MNLDADLYSILKTSVGLSAATGGSFDITVGPLVELWSDTLARGVVPSRRQILAASEFVGYSKVKFRDGTDAEMARGMKIDLGGIGKGYSLDRIGDILKAAGVHVALVNFGGSSMYALGAPPGKSGWEIAINGPAEILRGSILLRDAALSTSGTMGRYWTVGGKTYGHIIDPKLGKPVTAARIATVITKSATAAEALSKPIVISGAAALAAVTAVPGSEAVLIPEHGSPRFTAGFRSKWHWRELPAT
jgi:thiamine biosynthesis lipoprotein